jgi:hypothetical protein
MPLVSAQQGSFYTKNGYLELEELLTASECAAFLSLMQNTHFGRDLWRQNPPLKELLLSRRMSKLALHLTGKSSLRLACDQWFPPGFSLEKLTKFKDLFCIQGIVCIILLQLQPGRVQKPSKMAPLGLFPFPQGCGNALIVNSELLINWPVVSSDIGLYAAAYSLPPAVYVQNTRDPAALFLKQLGYGYGDPLTNETHPLIIQ